MNPVARRELQERFRTLRSPVLLSLWVLAGGALTFLAYLYARDAATSRLSGYGLAGIGSIVASASMGRFILQVLLLGLLTAIVFVVPGQAAVSIVGERERQTLPLLQVSQLSAGRIVMGKLASALAYLLLLLVATTPLMVIPVLLGGVTLWQVISGVAMVMAAAVMFGSVSIWVSSRAKSVQGAVLGSYMWTVALVFGTFALLIAEVMMAAPDDLGRTRFDAGVPRDEGREIYSSWINPYFGVVDASYNTLSFQSELIDSPYAPFRSVLLKRQGFAASQAGSYYGTGAVFQRDVFIEAPVPIGGFLGGSSIAAPSSASFAPIRSAVWWKTLLFEALVSGLTLWGATRMVTTPRSRIRLRRSRKAAADAS